MLPELLHVGSVKNIYGKEGESPYYFEYSDRYSVFDWGSMPDALESKGNVLAGMADFFFRYFGSANHWQQWECPDSELAKSSLLNQLRQEGLLHHGIGLVNRDLEQSSHSNIYKVEAVKVIRPEGRKSGSDYSYDYSAYQNQLTNALVPLEVIFRFGVPEGSSLLKRIEDTHYLKQLGLSQPPQVGDEFQSPIVEFSSKLENVDRYLDYEQAKAMAGLSESELQNLITLVKLLAMHLKDVFGGVQIKLWDGKFEFAFARELNDLGERKYMLVDSIGPDELRLTYEGTQLSKECLRKYYRTSEWFQNVEKAKSIAKAEGEVDWKNICIERLLSEPPKLNNQVKTTIEMMYKSLLNELTKKYENQSSDNVWPIEKVAKSIKEILHG